MSNLIQPVSEQSITEAAGILRRGGLVAFPTETVYGLGAHALDEKAVARIFSAKGRPANDPLIVHVAEDSDLRHLVRECPPAMDRVLPFWPGPLTLVLPRAGVVPDIVTAGLDTVAVRIPSHPAAQTLLRATRLPIAAPSANRFGHTSPTTARHVLEDLGDSVDLILDGGPTTLGVESTVLDLTTSPPTLLRPGGVTLEELTLALGNVQLKANQNAPMASPGLFERHYAPHAEFHLCMGPVSSCRAWLRDKTLEYLKAGVRVGLLIAEEDVPFLADLGADMQVLGGQADIGTLAKNLYSGLRSLDDRSASLILARDFGETGLARAVRDRLVRAANGRVFVLFYSR